MWTINVREYRRDNKNLTIQRNWQHRNWYTRRYMVWHLLTCSIVYFILATEYTQNQQVHI